jgi:hypothetical protein
VEQSARATRSDALVMSTEFTTACSGRHIVSDSRDLELLS